MLVRSYFVTSPATPHVVYKGENLELAEQAFNESAKAVRPPRAIAPLNNGRQFRL
jgi:hypothetical protein